MPGLVFFAGFSLHSLLGVILFDLMGEGTCQQTSLHRKAAQPACGQPGDKCDDQLAHGCRITGNCKGAGVGLNDSQPNGHGDKYNPKHDDE